MLPNLSASEENYLKSVYHLQQQKQNVTTNVLAGFIRTKPASVTDMLKKLHAKNLIDYNPYKSFRLSKEGNKAAVIIIRRHRLWEFFLTSRLKFNWEEVHEIAEQLEHVTSRKLVDKLDSYLGHPRFDPHGDPIPDSNGKIIHRRQMPLSNLALNTPATITSVQNQSADLLLFLSNNNLSIGTKVLIKQKLPFDNSLEIKIKNNQLTISQQVADAVWVNAE